MESSPLKLTDNEIYGICKKYFLIIKGESFKFRVQSVNVKPFSDEPAGFLGAHYILSICVRLKKVSYTTKESTKLEEWISCFVKELPNGIQKQKEYIEGFGTFKKEIALYQYLIPRLQDACIGSEDWAGKCLFTKNDEMLVFENLQSSGFNMSVNKNGLLDFDHLVVALSTLARFHAASVVLETRNRCRIIDQSSCFLQENAYPSDATNIRIIGFEKAVQALSALVKMIPKYQNKELQVKIFAKFHGTMCRIFDFCKTSECYRNVVAHGDLWANNVLFKYEEKIEANGVSKNVPIAARLVDFQLARYAPPALDVLSLITIPTDSSFRDKHLQELLSRYYESLKCELDRHALDINDILPEVEFKECCDYFKLAGIIESCLFSHLTLLPPAISKSIVSDSDSFEKFIKNSRESICQKAFQTDDNYRHRMSNLLINLVDVYILKNK